MLGARGTPTTFVNGIMITGAVPFETFQKAIDAEIARANALLQKGIPRKNLYEIMLSTGEGVTAQGKSGSSPSTTKPADPNNPDGC